MESSSASVSGSEVWGVSEVNCLIVVEIAMEKSLEDRKRAGVIEES